jgi:hypothetical protein
MGEQVKVDLQDNSPYRVALDLAREIADSERGSTLGGAGQKQDRDYWLKPYLQCRSVVLNGIQIKEAG